MVCPGCKEPFRAEFFREEGGRVIDGLLISGCGNVYPVVNSIPRILPNAFNDCPQFVEKYKERIRSHTGRLPGVSSDSAGVSRMTERTKKSFGYQWTIFSEMTGVFKEDFLNYIYPVKEDFFKGKLGLDAGCGMGRHIHYAAQFGAHMIGIDFSGAIDATYQNVKENPRIDLVQCDIYNLPFRPNTFDFVYSIGVLHHLPDPEKGFARLCEAAVSSVFIWVYSKKRIVLNFLLEAARKITTRILHRALDKICLVMAVFEWLFFIGPYKVARKLMPGIASTTDRFVPARIRLYAKYPFFVCHTDWFDRLAAPIRFYYDRTDMAGWAKRANLKNTCISPTGLYGWRLYGEKT